MSLNHPLIVNQPSCFLNALTVYIIPRRFGLSLITDGYSLRRSSPFPVPNGLGFTWNLSAQLENSSSSVHYDKIPNGQRTFQYNISHMKFQSAPFTTSRFLTSTSCSATLSVVIRGISEDCRDGYVAARSSFLPRGITLPGSTMVHISLTGVAIC